MNNNDALIELKTIHDFICDAYKDLSSNQDSDKKSNQQTVIVIPEDKKSVISKYLSGYDKDIEFTKEKLKQLYKDVVKLRDEILKNETSTLFCVLKHRFHNDFNDSFQTEIEKLIQKFEIIVAEIKLRLSGIIKDRKINKPINKLIRFDTPIVFYCISRQAEKPKKADIWSVPAMFLHNSERLHFLFDADYDCLLVRMVHEYIHYLSHNGKWNGIYKDPIYLFSFRITNENCFLFSMNEAITELLTMQIMGSMYIAGSKYDSNAKAMSMIAKTIGEDLLVQAYFQNKPQLLRKEFDKTMGKGKFNDLASIFSNCLSENKSVVEKNANQRDKMISEFVSAYKP